ncbi:EAL domain-containing protein [Ideonella sp. DXS29W]|uniref:EAL domain-containing protein n=1 Tax=Ideonella lacteola TaxID=2984193 RepID=A0ABU9BS42_9BURK
MPRPSPQDHADPRGAVSANEALAAALERLPHASGAVWLRGLLGVVITVLMLAAWAFVNTADGLAVSSAGDAEALHLAGRQVFLAERLAARALSAGNGIDDTAPLNDTLKDMVADAGRLHELSGVWGDAEDDRGHWTHRREQLWGATRSLLMARERGETALEPFVGQVQAEARQFISAMEPAAKDLQHRAEERHAASREAHAVLVGLLALGVTVLLLGLGEPLARRMRQHHQRLCDQTEQLQRLALVADRTQNAVVLTDAQARIVWVNAAFTRMTGYTLAEAEQQRIDTLTASHDGDAAGPVGDEAQRAALSQALAQGTPLRAEMLNRCREGRSYWVDVDVQPLRQPDGTLTGFVIVQNDITAQVERRDYLGAILRALPAGLMVQDAEGRIVDANLKAEQLTGIPREQMIGRRSVDPQWAIVNAAGAPLQPEELPSVITLRTGEPQVDQPIGVHTADGQRRWLRVNTQTLPGPGGTLQGVVTCFLDETEVRAQRNLLQTTIDGAGVGTWDWNMQTGRIDYNDRWARMFGFAADELPRTLDEWQALVHPEDASASRAALKAHLADDNVPYRTEFRMRHRGGEWRWVMAAGAVIERGPDGRGRRMAGVNVDIHARKRLEQALSDAALTDTLTKLPNRAGIQQALARCVERVQAVPGAMFAVLFMDFDRFKLVNDSLGHDAGDELLRQIAARVKQTLRNSDDVVRATELPEIAGRLGGDEFVVLLDRISRPADATRVAGRLLEALAAPYQVAGRAVQSTASIGIVTSDVSSANVESVLRDADTAMYEAKRRGRGRYEVFDPEMHRRIRHVLELEADLRLALQQEQLYVVYQPIVDLVTHQPVGLEALARWHHPQRGPVSPAEFVPIAEEAGLIEQLGEQVLRRACADLAAWQRTMDAGAPESVAVNLSRAQLRPGHLAAAVSAALQDSGLGAQALRLEITETLAMQGESAHGVLAELREMGVSLALDDFGTGYSSLASLDQLPIDTVKIDRAFVAKMVHNPYQTALVKSTVQVADALALRVVAEGVETEAQADALAALGCHAAQGYLFGRPMSAADFAAWWTTHQSAVRTRPAASLPAAAAEPSAAGIAGHASAASAPPASTQPAETGAADAVGAASQSVPA